MLEEEELELGGNEWEENEVELTRGARYSEVDR